MTPRRWLLLAVFLALLLWGALAMCVDQIPKASAKTPPLVCGWSVRRGIASHVGYGYPWRETAELRKAWGELPYDLNVAEMETWRFVAVHDVFLDRSLIGRRVLLVGARGEVEHGWIMDAMANPQRVADLDPIMARKLNGGVLQGGTAVTLFVPEC